jgi:hypothetical protein
MSESTDPSIPTAPTMPDDLMAAKERYEGWVKVYREAKDKAERLEGIASDARFQADCARRSADSLGRQVDALQREYAALIVRLGAVPSTITQDFPATDPDRLTT